MKRLFAQQQKFLPMNKLLITSMVLSFSLALTACGGGGGSEATPAPVPTILPDVEISSFDDPLIGYQWYLQSIKAVSNGDYVRDGNGNLITGDTVRVAVIDTGLELGHEDITENATVGASYNFFDDSNQPTPDTSLGDHGTGVSGIVAARGGNTLGGVGIAPSAELRAFKLLNSEGGTSISISDQLAAIGYDPSNNYPDLVASDVDVFNLSYGFAVTYDPSLDSNLFNYYSQFIDGLQIGTENLRDGKGALYIKAAGNEFADIDGNTGTYECVEASDNGVTCFNVNFERDQTTPYLIPVAAYDDSEKKASFSNTGSALWISAPGVGTVTIDQSGCEQGYSRETQNGIRTDTLIADEDANCNYFSYFGGTSAATPIVSGVISLILEANPQLTWRDIKHILATTARQIDVGLTAKYLANSSIKIEQGWIENNAGYRFSNYYGFGAVDAQAAVNMATDNYNSLAALQTIEQTGNVTDSGNIPDNNAAGITETMTVNQGVNLILESVSLKVSMSEQLGADGFDFSDYVITLISPNGTESLVMTPFTGFAKNTDVTDYPMITHAFYGETLNGDWKLKIQDVDSQTDLAGEGELVDWSLTFYGHEEQ
ncbi:Serine protease [uncultured Thiomicrorhabdus sp.]